MSSAGFFSSRPAGSLACIIIFNTWVKACQVFFHKNIKKEIFFLTLSYFNPFFPTGSVLLELSQEGAKGPQSRLRIHFSGGDVTGTSAKSLSYTNWAVMVTRSRGIPSGNGLNGSASLSVVRAASPRRVKPSELSTEASVSRPVRSSVKITLTAPATSPLDTSAGTT